MSSKNWKLGVRSQNSELRIQNSELKTEDITPEFKIYRQAELNRTTASLLANGAILIAGEDGSGKSVLANAVVEKLQTDGFMVAFIEPATPKQMLLEIAHQFDIPTEDLEGKSLTADKLKRAIADFLESNTAFLVLDDAHACDAKFRMWLKQLRRSNVPMLLLATDPPRIDIFINIPRIELKPLPESTIREIMIAAALERGISLKPAEMAKIQSRAGGNPTLAIRSVEEEYLGLEVEEGDHRRYFDITPLILLAGIAFVIMRFIGLGTSDQALYIFGGIAAAIFLGLSRLLYNLPRESQRIR
ncbi:9-O-acetyl-N-acetylneuraminate esterase [Nostoc linckia z18]|uniref:9-O-acetyl-N-acetylneuraminate esterase n=2 Tax=Nostoc linckia TaxID=92942 RepID=A0A9Q5ZCH1_NOSLI|nr:9-O-acetyl-N-acetylneuraminate esterase [Nostoc linckia z1]PHJ61931.1 9-O-acetyl-N-acetylneuraminate esterase [Nostoc linckia z3]PHJ67845.1 9-O-acetyl-N-acetylneuraminate esterase [Nostoc linckia z2]PHJ79028.1 9-O-acetyl-N-acetylneuraminate esterase [Nostoc linckia z4]PHJ83352.1 9-O-acetyl-N-acetylneuraminate esterase [Nostoc linckia z6]PHJ95654.1 9-O-acetyl-N-acetylneuraminate esterase [Nostoc linckia z7]PHK03598.1 9-O-acetyl-N-acetylneuraminate esterase [Nostoc linckia z8]PHK09809.1 9-O